MDIFLSFSLAARLNAAEKPKDNSAFRQPAETINCQLLKGPKTLHKRAGAAHTLFPFLSVSSIIDDTFRFPPGFRGSAREVRRWRFIPLSCCIVGALWLQKGQSCNWVQGCHLLVDLSCSSSCILWRRRRKNCKRAQIFCSSFPSLVALNKSSKPLPPKSEKPLRQQDLWVIWPKEYFSFYSF